MPANPYATFLNGHNPHEVIGETPNKLEALAQRLGQEGLQRSTAPGKWTATEILCHLADCEIAFAFRLRQALAEPRHIIQPFDQDAWAKPYQCLDGQSAVATFTAIRRWNVALLGATPKESFNKTLNHPERGDMTFQTVVETMAGHDLNHITQLEKIASA